MSGQVASRADPLGASDASTRRATRTKPAHVVVIVMENHEYGSIIGSSSAPYINRLARQNVLLTHSYAIRHPSLPNYLALTGGSTFGVTSDCTDCNVGRKNIVDQLESHHMSWQAYMQGMPRPCFTGSGSGDYAKKHDPFMYYNDIRNRRSRCKKVVPFTRFRGDLRGGLPRFAWITPDLCKDMHDCSVQTGDRFLHTWVPRIMRHLGRAGILIVTFDEGDSNAGCCGSSSGGGHIATIIAGPGARNSVKITSRANHYSTLRLIEDALGLGRLAHTASRSTPTIRGWQR